MKVWHMQNENREQKEDISKYNDIINLSHHESDKRPHMPIYDRAAQFAPFAAMSGHEEAILETQRLTDEEIKLSEDELAELDMQAKQLTKGMSAVITYFVPDNKKAGGRYVTDEGIIKSAEAGCVKLKNGVEIQTDRIISISACINASI